MAVADTASRLCSRCRTRRSVTATTVPGFSAAAERQKALTLAKNQGLLNIWRALEDEQGQWSEVVAVG